MRKGKFFVGIVMFVIAAVAFVIGTYMIVTGLIGMAQDSTQAIGLVIILPIAFVSYAAELVATVISVACLAPYRRDYDEPSVRTASKIIIIEEIALMIIAIGLVAYMYITQGATA